MAATIDLMLLDAQWRPLHRLPANTDWRETMAALMRLDSYWIAIEQRRAADAPLWPDASDIALTRALRRRLRAMDIQLADHVIHTAEGRFSFRAAGLL